MAKKKNWVEILDDSKDFPKVVPMTGKMVGKWGIKKGDTLAIPSSLKVDSIMRKVPKEKLTTINIIRKITAEKYGAKIGCPIKTDIFVKISVFAAEENKSKGETNITPYLRTLKEGGILNEKYPRGVEKQM